MKIVINRCFGGFGISKAAFVRLRELGCNAALEATENEYNYIEINYIEIKRDDLLLVRVVEELGDKANGQYAELKIVDVPDGIDWEIAEYDGMESVKEKHRSWV